jgi:hypothetical protein
VTENTGLDHGECFAGVPMSSVHGRNRTAPVIAKLLNQVVPAAMTEQRLPEISLALSADPESRRLPERRLTGRRPG